MIHSFTKIFKLKYKTALTLLFCFILFLRLDAHIPHSQNTKISLDFTQASLHDILKEIEQKTTYTFFYKNEDIDFSRKITIKTSQSSIESILLLLFENENITYEILDKKIIITKKQQFQISGKVIDKSSGAAIAYCNITSLASTTGTASNELGEFIIQVSSLPTTLVFSHIIYGEQTREVFEASDEVVIELDALVNVLEEVTIVASKSTSYALNLSKSAFRKAEKAAKKEKYGKALYRQKTENGKQYAEFSEIIYDIRYTSEGIEDWEILEGRYALKENTVHNRNYTLLSRLLKPLQPNTDELIFPLHTEMETFYDVSIIGHINSEDQQIAVVQFKPKENKTIPIFEGEVYINIDTYDILKINGTIARDDLKLVQLKEKNNYWKNYKLSYEIGYKVDSTSSSTMDYLKVDQIFDYFKEGNFLFQARSTSNLTFFEHYTPLTRKKLGGKYKKDRSDWQLLNEIGYNERFWEENQIVKRTPIEEEIISAFEKDNAFGSIFLNSRDRVAVLQSNLSDDPFIRNIGKSINSYNNYNPIEKVYLHTDKDLFAAGENIWYSAYVVLGSYHQYSLASKILHVDLIGPDNTIITSQTKELLNGKNAGAIKLPESLPSGNYRIRSYTQWMQNSHPDFFFTKSIKVLNPNDNSAVPYAGDNSIDLQFFPEGGYSIAGLNGVIAFRAIGENGLAKKIQGKVLDSKGNFVCSLNTISNGSGFFNLSPRAGEQYIAMLADGSEHPLPKVMDKGYAITVSNVNSKSVKVAVQATESLRDSAIYVIGHSQNKKYFQGKFEFGNNPTITFEIPKNKIPSGIMTLTLFDIYNKPWCERIVFINNREELVITTNLSQKKFQKRAKIALDVHVTDADGKPISSPLSIAVTDAGQRLKTSNSNNILTHLLLQSDIRGTISNPGALFKNQKRATLHKLDLVMLTHGWRKLNWEKVMDNPQTRAKYPFSKGLSISGIATTLSDRPLANATIIMFGKSKKDASVLTAQTDSQGKFMINDFNLSDSVEVIFKAYNSKKRPVNLKVKLDKNELKIPPQNATASSFFKTDDLETYITRINLDNEKTTVLEEVVVAADRNPEKNNPTTSIYGVRPDATLYTKDYDPTDLLTLISRFPGVRVTPGSVSIRNGGNPLWVLDGIPLTNSIAPTSTPAANSRGSDDPTSPNSTSTDNQANSNIDIGFPSGSSGNIPPTIQSLNIFSIERVELLKGPSAAIYGVRGGNGVILIYTKVNESGKSISSPSFSIQGHTATKEFYVPKYDILTDNPKNRDTRSTLYWNPNVRTDANGNARVYFFNSDVAKQIQVEIEGLSTYGIPGVSLKTYGNTN